MIKIRKATMSDFGKLKALRTEFFLWGCRMDKRMNPDYVKRGLGLKLAKNLKHKNRMFFVAEQDGELIAYSCAEIKKNPAFVKPPKRGHLFNLYVKKKYRSKGIGNLLINETLKWFKSKKVSDLEIMTHSFNKKAKK